MKNLFILFFLLTFSSVNLAVTRYSPSLTPTPSKQALSIEFGKSGILSAIDPQGKWIQINGKKYKLGLHKTVVEKVQQIPSGKKIFYNLENGAVTRIWSE
jgi:hypothetical protein